MVKKIYLEPTWKIHSSHKELFLYPPEGYKYVFPDSLSQSMLKAGGKKAFSHSLLHSLNYVLPLNLIKSAIGIFNSIPRGCDLTYSFGHMIFRREPWVVELETVTNFTGHNDRFLKKTKRLIERVLSSKYCKKIIVWNDIAMKTILMNLDCSSFMYKLAKINLGIRGKNFTKIYDNRVKILFINSANILGNFERKGGLVALEAFRILKQRYHNVELVMRTDVPTYVKRKYGKMEGLHFIEDVLPHEFLEREYKSSDIFLTPATDRVAPMAILEAMSYELPVVATDIWYTSELVQDGRTGYLVKKSQKLPYHGRDFLPNHTLEFIREVIKTVDLRVVQDVVDRLSILTENESLRRKMGKAARLEVEEGTLSLKRRDEKLKKIFDEATA